MIERSHPTLPRCGPAWSRPLVLLAGLLLAGPLVVGPLVGAATPAAAQMSESDLVVRLNQLESQMRRLTGDLEQAQFRNQQLEQQLKRMQEDYEFRFQELGRGGGRGAPSAAPSAVPGRRGEAPVAPPQQQAYAPPAGATELPAPPAQQPYGGGQAYAAADATATAPAGRGRRGDAFDPSQSPGAPGTPRVLGQPGAPLDLSSMSAAAASDPSLARGPAGGGALPPPPQRNPNATGAQLATLPPGAGAKDEYDLAYGYVLRKDYALAEQTFREFLRKHPGDRLAVDAQYWLGESLFLRKSYKEAADAFLAVTQRAGANPKGADAFLRLGQSLAAMNQKDMACASFAQIGARYPRASINVKQTVEREQKRVHCL
ncbi:tol-pal system protein YbgF [Rhodoplanes roseus]|uniref:Cell division coordinator CpoB n=1 Tax=Rhodoplanes roseus TaxID=29409 RepID=A0A327L1L4_9BRAD|nr:tol-pal system protein YbgF [Rhodoplanes roseus]RAI44386.1 tol-pal system protein YbgF [Rhodoplanes roseus]